MAATNNAEAGFLADRTPDPSDLAERELTAAERAARIVELIDHLDALKASMERPFAQLRDLQGFLRAAEQRYLEGYNELRAMTRPAPLGFDSFVEGWR